MKHDYVVCYSWLYFNLAVVSLGSPRRCSAVLDKQKVLFVYYEREVKYRRMCFIIAVFNGDFPFLDFTQLPVTAPVE